MIENNQARWLWYPGDFEIRQGLLQNFSREERGYDWPAYWNMDDCHRNVKFKRYYELSEETSFIVYATGIGYAEVNGKKYSLGKEITCQPGKNKIRVFIGNTEGLPAVFIEGEIIKSDLGWVASNFIDESPAGWSSLYLTKDHDPNRVYYECKVVSAVSQVERQGGVLIDYGRAIFGTLAINKLAVNEPVTICYGESESEALDIELCYYKEKQATSKTVPRKRAFRYLFIPNVTSEQVSIDAIHEYLPLQNKATFHSNDELLNKIWSISVETFTLCSGLFFIDGIKRDRWIWSGDAYQSYFINQYLFFDEEINTRTMLALRGQNEMKQHMNTIVDYSILWVIAIENHYMMSGDKTFLKQIYPKMQSMMSYLEAQTNQLGFIYGRKKDWLFIDWSEMDREGALAAEQILLLKAYQTMQHCADILGEENGYTEKYEQLKENVMTYFWDNDKQAFIDSYESGNRNVTRHANIFAILFDLVDQEKKEQILENVLLNDEITEITTPYFKFFEQDALCKMGQTNQVYQIMCDYWGGMVEKNAVTFWEEYIPEEKGDAIYEMYGDPFGKSLCHAWGASPIYLLGRYFAGIKPTSPGYQTFAVEPKLDTFTTLDVQFPIKNGLVKIKKEETQLIVSATKAGGILKFDGKEYPLEVAKECVVMLEPETI